MQTSWNKPKYFWTNFHLKRSTERMIVVGILIIVFTLIILSHTPYLKEFRYSSIYFYLYYTAILLLLSFLMNRRYYVRVSTDSISVRTLKDIHTVNLKKYFFNNLNRYELSWHKIWIIEIALLRVNLLTENNETFTVPFFYMNYAEIKELKSVLRQMAALHSIELRKVY